VFDFLLNKSNIGVYNKCEIIEIFGIKKNYKIPFNIFTLIVFENTKQIDIEGLMTEKLHKFENIKDINWGIKRRIVDISIVEKLYADLLNKKIFQIDKQLEIGSLKLLPEQYIQPEDSLKKPQLNYILKNNFNYGSYILEFFDEDKSNCQFLFDNPDILNSFSEKLSEIIPIKIGNLSDRLGNIIFQFPINSFSMTWSTIKNEELHKYEGLKFEIEPKSSNFDINNLLIRVYEENDNAITRQRLVEVKNKTTEILLDDCFGTTIEIFDKNSSLLLYKNKFSIMKQINFNMQIEEDQERVFDVNGQTQKVNLKRNQKSLIGKKTKREYFDWILKREDKPVFRDSNKFSKQYCKQKEKALDDIKELINRYGQNEVYLLDPFLDNDDIKNTLFHSSNIGTKLKAITALEQRKLTQTGNFCIYCKSEIDKDKLIKAEMINNMKIRFENDDKTFYNIDLEVRAVYKVDDDFHDRYLICVNGNNNKVYNLGTSINSIGNKLHSIEEVYDNEYIINFAKNLWEKLDKEECLVWKCK
jgi:hypothetical protein